MKLIKKNPDQQFLNTLCQKISERNFKEVEKTLLNLIDTVLLSNNVSLKGRKTILQTIYYSFNCFYYHWSKMHNINIEQEREQLHSCEHSNFLISHSTDLAQMDDLLYDLGSYLESNNTKDEVLYNLSCYKKKLSS